MDSCKIVSNESGFNFPSIINEINKNNENFSLNYNNLESPSLASENPFNFFYFCD